MNKSGNCKICGIYRESLHRDHIQPRWDGGSDEPDNIQFICANCHQDKTLRETKSDEFRDYRNHLGQWIYHMNRIESNKKQPKPVVIPNKNPVGRPHKLSADLRKRVNFKLTPLMANWLKQQKNITATIEKLITEAMIDDP
jgi:hypothetical protein